MSAITPLPPVPTRADPTNFAPKADTLLTHLEDVFVPELNALSDDVTLKSTQVSTNAATAASSAATAQASANFLGEWSTLTGAKSPPASVSHSGRVYLLKQVVTDITVQVPGVATAYWLDITNILQGVNTAAAGRVSLQVYSTAETEALANVNTIRNPVFYLDTRGVGSSVTLAAGAVGHDRWKAGTGGCTYTLNSRGTTLLQAEKYVNITAGSLGQYIDPRLLDRTENLTQYVLSWEGTAEARINDGAWSTSDRLVDQGGTINGGMVTSTLDGSGLLGVFVEFRNGTVIRPQFKRANAASIWIASDFDQDVNDALRYAWSVKGASTFAYRGYNTAGTSAFMQVFFPLPMRAVPTVTKVGTWSVTNCSQPTITDVTTTGFLIRTNVTATGTFSFNTVDSTTGITAFTTW